MRKHSNYVRRHSPTLLFEDIPCRVTLIEFIRMLAISDLQEYFSKSNRLRLRTYEGTRSYEKLSRAHKKGEAIPQLVTQASKDFRDVPEVGKWADDFDETIVHIERVIAYWSRILKSAERNYSPTEREALALKEALIKFQPLIEGEDVVAVTDHAALTWSKTYQNVNRRLLTWGTVFSAYPKLKIVHRAGRVHSNVDPVSRLRRRYQGKKVQG